jgi:sulfur carrier protein
MRKGRDALRSGRVRQVARDKIRVRRFPQVIHIIVNGEPRTFEQALNAEQLVERLGLGGKRVALERNGEIVPRGRFADQRIGDGDRLEIVVAVGGG